MSTQYVTKRTLAGLWQLAVAVLIAWGLSAQPAEALPSFARQTGQTCSACHLGFPQLTPFGRQFKLNGYVWQGGKSKIPHIAFMLQPAFTHTAKDQPGGAAPHYGPNDNFDMQQVSVFYGGSIYSPIGLGAFAQVTYDSPDRAFGWDNIDIRLAHTFTVGGKSLVAGLDANNSPTSEDLWNTTPAWRLPAIGPELAPGPGATLIEDGLGQEVAGLGGYAMWNNLIYANFEGYRTLGRKSQIMLGADPTVSADGIIPYWRVAIEPSWGNNSLEFGTFGLMASLYPDRIKTGGTDSYQDIGIDAQYQYIGSRDGITFAGSWIHEDQDLNASFLSGDAGNRHNHLNSLNLRAAYLYRQMVGASVSYFSVYGNSDAGLYGDGSVLNSPDTAGWVFQVSYMPFNEGGPSFWPWLNAKIGLQYIVYNKFNGRSSNYDGSGRSASDNNTLFLFAWVAF